MAHAPSSAVQNPVTEQAFEADRMKMWGIFCNMAVIGVVGSIVTLGLMALFLV